MTKTLFPLSRWIDAGATFSPDRRYRYSLYRIWDERLPAIGFCGLNPSTADEHKEDPTIRRCLRFARDWGYGALTMLNAYAFRSTLPVGLWQAECHSCTTATPTMLRPWTERPWTRQGCPMCLGTGNDPVGPENDAAIAKTVAELPIIVACWGNNIRAARHREVLALLGDKARHLGLTARGMPCHPLYLKASTELRTF